MPAKYFPYLARSELVDFDFGHILIFCQILQETAMAGNEDIRVTICLYFMNKFQIYPKANLGQELHGLAFGKHARIGQRAIRPPNLISQLLFAVKSQSLARPALMGNDFRYGTLQIGYELFLRET